MRTIKFVGYLLYRYYSKGSRANIPYFSAICSMTLLGYMHLVQILILLNSVDFIPVNFNDNNFAKRLIMFFLMLPLYFLMSNLFRKKDIGMLKAKYDYNWDKVFSGNVRLIIYKILSISLIFVLLFLKK